jgi:hypothetical protein
MGRPIVKESGEDEARHQRKIVHGIKHDMVNRAESAAVERLDRIAADVGLDCDED